MLKLFILTLTLFSTVPMFAMRAITSRLQQRGYATMTKENFTRLVDHQKNGYPLSPKAFASELVTMKKDNEDLENIWINLSLKVKNLNDIREYNILDPILDGLPLCFILIGFEGMQHEIVMPLCYVIFVGGVLLALPALSKIIYLKDSNYTSKVLQRDKKNLAYIASLIEVNAGKLPWSQLAVIEADLKAKRCGSRE